MPLTHHFADNTFALWLSQCSQTQCISTLFVYFLFIYLNAEAEGTLHQPFKRPCTTLFPKTSLFSPWGLDTAQPHVERVMGIKHHLFFLSVKSVKAPGKNFTSCYVAITCKLHVSLFQRQPINWEITGCGVYLQFVVVRQQVTLIALP